MKNETIEKLNQSIQAAPFLTDLEKELLSDIVPHWPNENLADLQNALQYSPLAGVMDPEHQLPPPHATTRPVEHYVITRQAVKPVTSPGQTGNPPTGLTGVAKQPQSNLQDILKRLEGETVAFSATGGRVGPGAGVSERAHTVVVEPGREHKARPPIAPAPVRPAPPRPAPTVNKISPPIQIAGKSLAQMNSVKDLTQITINHLRQGDFKNNLLILRNKIAEIANREHSLAYNVIKNLDASPLHNLFVRSGFALLDDTDKERNQVFARAAKAMQAKFGTGFSQKEFELYTDFRDELEQLM